MSLHWKITNPTYNSLQHTGGQQRQYKIRQRRKSFPPRPPSKRKNQLLTRTLSIPELPLTADSKITIMDDRNLVAHFVDHLRIHPPSSKTKNLIYLTDHSQT